LTTIALVANNAATPAASCLLKLSTYSEAIWSTFFFRSASSANADGAINDHNAEQRERVSYCGFHSSHACLLAMPSDPTRIEREDGDFCHWCPLGLYWVASTAAAGRVLAGATADLMKTERPAIETVPGWIRVSSCLGRQNLHVALASARAT